MITGSWADYMDEEEKHSPDFLPLNFGARTCNNELQFYVKLNNNIIRDNPLIVRCQKKIKFGKVCKNCSCIDDGKIIGINVNNQIPKISCSVFTFLVLTSDGKNMEMIYECRLNPIKGNSCNHHILNNVKGLSLIN